MDNQESILEKLKKDGWTRQFVANEPRLSEAVDLYKETGYEVHLEPIPKADNLSELPMVGSECTTCFDGNEDQYKIIFTRQGKSGPTSNDELFD